MAVQDRDARRLDRKIDRVSRALPGSVGGFLRWLQTPSSRWLRIPLAVLLIAGGLASFLPVLGIWMLPLGLLLIAQDLPFLQRPLLRLITWLERKWKSWRRSWWRWWAQ